MKQTADDLVQQFHRLLEPTRDPDHDLRKQLRGFFREYLNSKGSEGVRLSEAEERLREARRRNPKQWPEELTKLLRLLREAVHDPSNLPPLSPRAQLMWLGIEGGYSSDTIDAAIFIVFPATIPPDMIAAWQETRDHLHKDARAHRVHLAAFKAWADLEMSRGRPEGECLHGNFLSELDLIVPGTRRIELERLKQVADPEMRHATLAAAWAADQQAEEVAYRDGREQSH